MKSRCAGGGTGIHKVLKTPRLLACGFESRPAYQLYLEKDLCWDKINEGRGRQALATAR